MRLMILKLISKAAFNIINRDALVALSICFSLSFSSISYGQISIDTASYFIYDSITNTSTDWSRYIGAFDTLQLISLNFSDISKNEFSEYRKKYHSKINTDSSKVAWTDTSFIIKTNSDKKVYNTRITDDFPYNYYLGFLDPLNLYIVSNIDGRNELGMLLLIDKQTGKEFYYSSGYDYPCEALCISPKNNYLLSYANNWAEHNQCMISVMKIVKSKNNYKLKALVSFDSDSWTINDIAWINDNSFALSVKEKIDLTNYDKENGVDHYFKASFDR